MTKLSRRGLFGLFGAGAAAAVTPPPPAAAAVAVPEVSYGVGEPLVFEEPYTYTWAIEGVDTVTCVITDAAGHTFMSRTP